MALRRLSNADLIINNEKIAYSANSLTIMTGEPETTVEGVSVGGSASTTVHGRDYSTAFSEVKFTVPTGVDEGGRSILKEQMKEWMENIASNLIQVTDLDSNTSFTFQNCSLTNKPELTMSSDGTTSFEFKGDIAI